jgi:hypothetical protein
VVDIVDEQQEPQEQTEPDAGAVSVPVALERPDWTGHELTEVAAEDVLAAQHWDQRCWRRG